MYIEKLTMNYIFLNNDNFRYSGFVNLTDEIKIQFDYEFPLFCKFYVYYRLDINNYDDYIFDIYEDWKEVYLRTQKIKQLKNKITNNEIKFP